MTNEYNEDSIQVLEDIEHIRQRPLMYVSSERPSYQLFTEILDNAIDEVMNGCANIIEISVDFQVPSFIIRDNGRGIPQGINKKTGKATPEIIYTKLNSGGKYDEKSYKVHAGLHGVGSVVVNALSDRLEVQTYRDRSLTDLRFHQGELLSYEVVDCDKSSHGTCVTCYPDTSHKLISTDPLSNYENDILDRINFLKTLFPKVTFSYNGVMIVEKPLSTFLPPVGKSLLDEPITLIIDDIAVSFNWCTENNRYTYRAYCNSLYNPLGGDHEKGVADAICEYFSDRDAALGLTYVVSCMYSKAEYDSQAKLRATSPAMREYIRENLVSALKSYFKDHSSQKDDIVQLISQKRNDINKRNNKGKLRRDKKSTFLSSLGVSGFADCNTKDRELAELYLVEGNSAAGSAKQARDVDTQAIMPLRGKILNVLTSDIPAIMNNREIATIYANLATGIFQDFNIKKSRYGKVIIFTDADEDGKNIASLLIACFMHLSPELIESGSLYLALPPLYGVQDKDKFIPITDEDTKNEYLKKGFHVTRYKGLGEMNPEQLKVSCMAPETRRLLLIDKSEDCAEMIEKIMGSDTKFRRQLLIDEGVLVE